MLTPAEAEQRILSNLPLFLREDCPLLAAHGRVLREDVCADRDLPPFDRVTMDGYALRSAAVAAGVTTFRVEGTQAAGMRARKLGDAIDVCVEVMTGAVLPDGADCVVPYEEAKKEDATISLSPDAVAKPGVSVHRRGSDRREGEVVLAAGTRLTGREIAIAAAVGATNVTVTALPKIAILTTGDELVEVDSPVAAHQIRRSNDYALRAALIASGYPRVERFHLCDVRHEIEHLLWHVIAEHDGVLITGGVSKGKFDFLPAALEAQRVRKVFHGVAQRPGKPFWFGLSARRTPVFALPGNPVSAYTCLHRYVLPALARASGASAADHKLSAALTAPVTFKPPLAYLLPVKISSGPDARLLAAPEPTNTSGDFGGLLNSDGFVELSADRTEFPAGTVANFWRWV
ncbi:MAG TPA: molybdopterin molybdotransferase MoeA [Opitutus sp.]|nr:molybdopterin molybdotransferase MoeA [Opitutus sp.]